MSRLRTFIAIEPDSEIRAAGGRLTQHFSKAVDGVRWVLPENIHLTLKFLGDVEDRELHRVCQCSTEAAKLVKPFAVRAESVGAFPSNLKPSTIWMGVDDAQLQLADLHAKLESAMAQLGFPMEHRPFIGHLTLGRIRSSRNGNPQLTKMIEEYADREFGLLQVD